VVAVPTDMGDANQVKALSLAAMESFGRIDAWVNNAAALRTPRRDTP